MRQTKFAPDATRHKPKFTEVNWKAFYGLQYDFERFFIQFKCFYYYYFEIRFPDFRKKINGELFDLLLSFTAYQ